MSEFQTMDDKTMPSPINAVVGNLIHMKLVGSDKEKTLATVSIAPETVAKIVDIKKHVRANFTQFAIKAVSAGKASLNATDDKKAAAAGAIDVIVEKPLELPDEKKDVGMFARLFIAEVPSPEDPSYTLEGAKTSMIWMRAVLENRLAKPSNIWASDGAKSLQDVVKRKNQFAGFGGYPTIQKDIQKLIDKTLSIANDGGDSRRAQYKEFVETAIAVANQPKVTDPSSKGLFWWRTEGHGPPSGTPEAVVYMTKLGNTFFTLADPPAKTDTGGKK